MHWAPPAGTTDSALKALEPTLLSGHIPSDRLVRAPDRSQADRSFARHEASEEPSQARTRRERHFHYECEEQPTSARRQQPHDHAERVPGGLAVTARYCPLGESVFPLESSPQHWMVLSVRSPHEWRPPPVTALNCPLGASVCPPAGDGVVGAQSARVKAACGDRAELAVGGLLVLGGGEGAVDEGGHLGAGGALVGAEGAVAVAEGDAGGGQGVDGVVVGVGGGVAEPGVAGLGQVEGSHQERRHES